MTRMRSSGRSKARASSFRVTNEPWVLVETTSVPDGSSQAVQTCGSMYAWCTHGVLNVPSAIASLPASAAATSPFSRVMRSSTLPESYLGGVVLLPVVDAGVDGLEIAPLLRLLDDPRERGARLHRGLDVDDRVE